MPGHPLGPPVLSHVLPHMSWAHHFYLLSSHLSSSVALLSFVMPCHRNDRCWAHRATNLKSLVSETGAYRAGGFGEGRGPRDLALPRMNHGEAASSCAEQKR